MTIIINREATESEYGLYCAYKSLEETWGKQEASIVEDADKEALRTLQKQSDVLTQKKVALAAKQQEKEREKRKKDIEANNKNLKRFFHPNGE